MKLVLNEMELNILNEMELNILNEMESSEKINSLSTFRRIRARSYGISIVVNRAAPTERN